MTRDQIATDPEPVAADSPMERYVTTLRHRWRLAAVVVLVALFAGLLVSRLAGKQYDATATVVLGQQQQVDAALGTQQQSADPERDINTSVQLISLDSIADGVRSQLHTNEPAQALLAQVSTAVDSNSNLVSITAQDSDPIRAARIANAFAAGYKQFRARQDRAAVEDAVAAAQARLATLPAGPEHDALAAQVSKLQVTAAFQTGGVQIVRSATPPSSPSRPRPLLSAFIALLLGLVLAGAMIVFLSRTDKRVLTERDLELAVGQPVLATVPTGRGRKARGAAQEALMTLATRLTHVTRLPTVVLLTSAGPDEGTTDVTLGLAAAFGALGKRAIAIEADLRQPTFTHKLELPNGGGLVALLHGGDAVDRELVQLERSLDGGAAHVLPAGAARAHPQPLLASPSMAAIVAEARWRADIVLVCAPPVGDVGDALTLAPLADITLLVARLGATKADEARRAVRSLQAVEADVVGIAAVAGSERGDRDVGEMAPSKTRQLSPPTTEIVGPKTAPEAAA